MDDDSAKLFLGRNGWLSKLPAALKEDWLQGARIVKRSKGEQIFTAQDDPRFMVGVAQGTIGAFVSYHPQETRLKMLYEAGSWFGDAAVLTGNAHRGSAIARTECTCLVVPSAHVDAVAARHPEVWRWMASNIVFQFDSFSTLTEAALNRDPTCRLMTMMLSLHRMNPAHDTFDLSTEEIGQLVGLSRNTVSKSLHALAQANLIERRYASLRIKDIDALIQDLTKRTAS